MAASPSKVIGGHAVGVLSGSVFSFALTVPEIEAMTDGSSIAPNVAAALVVGFGIFGMVVSDTEHPPAAGTALGLVVHGWTVSAVVFILSSAVALSPRPAWSCVRSWWTCSDPSAARPDRHEGRYIGRPTGIAAGR